MMCQIVDSYAAKECKPLIVDFGRRKSYAGPTSFKKRVRFSPPQDNESYDCNDDAIVDANQLFYSKADYNTMRNERKRTIKDARRKYILLSSKGIFCQTEVLQCCSWNGIEGNLLPSILEKRRGHSDMCLRAVLDEQARQGVSGECDTEKLARVSQVWSTWAVERAEAIGLHQSVS